MRRTALIHVVLAMSACTADQQSFAPYRQTVVGTEIALAMTPIPGGVFRMGSPIDESNRKDDEGPQIEVEIEPFWMGVYEVTWAEVEPFLDLYHQAKMQEGGAPPIPQDQLADAVSIPSPRYGGDEAASMFAIMGDGGEYPAVSMRQFAAKQYCKWLSKKTGCFYRLPTEAEWEYACRAGTTTAYCFGDDPTKLDEYGWYFDNSQLEDGDAGYRKIGQKKPNAWGLYDMHGNVAEWVLDAHDPTHYQTLVGRRVPWSEAFNWPQQLLGRVVRGGSWASEAADCRCAARVYSTSKWMRSAPSAPQSMHWLAGRHFDIGFRVVRPVKTPSTEQQNRYWNADVKGIHEALEFNRDRHVYLLIPSSDKKNSSENQP